MKVLLVEDDEADVYLFRRDLRDRPEVKVSVVSTLAGAIEAANEEHHDIAVLDLSLVDSAGLQTLRKFLSSVEPQPAVVVLTGTHDHETALEALQAGAQDYLTKGLVRGPALLQVLRHSIERHRMARELLDAHERLRFLANHCALTGLPNRHLFMDRLRHSLESAMRSGQKPALLFLDLDRFKWINDTFGHEAGDAVLKATAERLGVDLRRNDLAARLGGDEFTLLLEGVSSPHDILRVVQKIHRNLSEPIVVRGRPVPVGGSIGVAVYPDDGETADELLRSADAAMYAAKRNGTDHEFFRAALREDARARLQIEIDLREALRDDDLELYYQPRIDGRNGEILGLEALARWHHPKDGWISPATFIPVAEQCGLIDQLGAWAIRRACQTQARWKEQGIDSGPVAVNVSPRQLTKPNFADEVRQTLAENGLPGRLLELEVTESSLVGDAEEIGARLGALRDLGVKLALDDFGTGYSNLGTLAVLPFDRLKIDRSFITPVADDARQALTTSAIITLGRNLRLEVVAEGVETHAQLEFLLERGCVEMQGFLFSKPLPEKELEVFLQAGLVPIPPR